MFKRPDKKPEFRKISDTIWEIPKDYREGMRVPARIYATKKLLDNMDLGVFEQVTNVAMMPGIVDYAVCHADGHQGYGMPIGGVAAFDLDNGVISPGSVGFDINCISGNTRILTKYGYYKRINDLENDYNTAQISFIDFKTKEKNSSNAILFLKKKPDCRVLKITTESGEELILTEDHPIYNGCEMVKAGHLKEGDNAIVHPFKGVEYEKVSDEIVLDEENIIAIVGNRKKLITTLKSKGLIPLRMNSDCLPILAGLLGFLTGDGWLGKQYSKKRKQDVWSMRAIGKIEDLEDIMEDINSLGYNIRHIKTKDYNSVLNEVGDGIRKISGESSQLYIVSQSFSVLMKALGMPEGNKSRTAFSVPLWIKNSPLWIKRLYLAGLFGAELTKPCQRKGEWTSFTEPSFSQNKIIKLEKENEKFILEIADLLLEFGIKINKIYKQKGVINSYGERTSKIALRLSAKIDNLIRLWSKIGYEYCIERKKTSMLAIAYLKKKNRVLQKTTELIKEGRGMVEDGILITEIGAVAEDMGLSRSIVQSQLYRNDQKNNVRIGSNFETFREFITEHSLSNSEFVIDHIENIKEIDYDDYVYDITMNDKNHNFIANCIVSSNCGMRLIKTDLTIKEVEPKIKELTSTLFEMVPAGVGSRGFVKINKNQFLDVVQEGVKWCVEQGYAWKEDLGRIEEFGTFKGANPDNVSQKAVDRGLSQLGTLGSGNHYLEVQIVKVENILDMEIAKKLGIFTKDQVVIMLHCGSRGFGHQIGTDYLKRFDETMKKYNIKLEDRELACAPINSKEGKEYYGAMACAANMAYANRQVITHQVREAFKKVFKEEPEKLGIELIQDNTHNLARIQKLRTKEGVKKYLVHLKGATRALGPGHEDLNPFYKEIGSGICIGGSMETGSYFLTGTMKAEEETFGTTAHGSGRTMSRTQARKEVRGEQLQKRMEKEGIYVKAASMSGLAEEAGQAYKNVDDVIDSLKKSGISHPVLKLIPRANVKG